MFNKERNEYVIETCPCEDTEMLEDLLNEMSLKGWELYSMNEAEGEEGFQYNCIFFREAGGSYESEGDDIADVGSFTNKMEKLLHLGGNPYEESKILQKNIKQKTQKINEIKKLLDSNSIEIDREKLNEEILEKLNELNVLKSEFSDAIDPYNMYNRVNQDVLTIVVSEELAELIDNEKNGELIIESVKLRQKLVDKFGYVIPPIHFVASDELCENEYNINVRNLKTLSGIAYDHYKQFSLEEANITAENKDVLEGIDPINAEKVFWLKEEDTKDFWEKGLSVSQVIINNLELIIFKYIDELISYVDVLMYVSLLGEDNSFLAEELIESTMSIGDLRYIFAALIREKVSLKDIVFVFEKLNDLMKFEYDNDQMVAQLRVLLKRHICSSLADADNTIYAVDFPEKLTDNLKKLLDEKSNKKYFIEDDEVNKFTEFVLEKTKKAEPDSESPVLIVPSELRRPVFSLFENLLPNLIVLSEDEIAEEFNVELA